MKALLAKQISRGQMRFDLVESSEFWLHQLWEKELYPYKEPFVFHLNKKYYISFPFPFSLLTSLFYKFLGYREFYLVPLISTWTIWLSVYFIGRILQLNSWSISLGLLLLIFASPLTFYSAMYWEHPLAVALSVVGIAIAFFTPENWTEGGVLILLGGFLVGSSVWFRSEFLSLVATLIFLTILGTFLELFLIFQFFSDREGVLIAITENKGVIFCTGMLLAVSFFWICNKLVYGRFLGIHSLLVLNEFSWKRRLKEAIEIFRQLNSSYFEYFLIAFFPAIYLFAFSWQKGIGILNSTWVAPSFFILLISIAIFIVFLKKLSFIKVLIKKRWMLLSGTILWSYFLLGNEIQISQHMWIVYLAYILYTIGVAYLVDFAPGEEIVGGKQWGPRYLLVLMPFTILLAVEQLQLLWIASERKVAYSSLIFTFILLRIGCYQNLYLGFQYFDKAHEGIAPAIQALKESYRQIVACSHQYATQALSFSLRDKKTLLCVENSKEMANLGMVLLEQDKLQKLLYVCYPYRPCDLIEEASSAIYFTHNNRKFSISLTRLGQFGRYPIYEATISPVH